MTSYEVKLPHMSPEAIRKAIEEHDIRMAERRKNCTEIKIVDSLDMLGGPRADPATMKRVTAMFKEIVAKYPMKVKT